MRLDVGADGIDEARAAIGRVSATLAGDGLVPICAAAMLPVMNDAKARAPFRTGTLRRGITITEQRKAGRDVRVAVGVSKGVPYARRIEYGFSGKDARGRTYNQPPRPYLRPALDAHRAEVIAEVGNAVIALVQRELGR